MIGPDDGTTRRSSRSAAAVDLYEQGEMLKWLQHHWSDNRVSYTLSFDPETIAAGLDVGPYFVRDEQNQLLFNQGQAVTHPAAAAAVPGIPGSPFGVVSARCQRRESPAGLPGVYAQLSEEPISEAEYDRRKAAIQPLDGTGFRGRGVEELDRDGARGQ